MNSLQTWILIKVLVVLLFFSGLFGMVRFFMLPEKSFIAMTIAGSALLGGICFLFVILRSERRMRKKHKDNSISFWDPWQKIDD